MKTRQEALDLLNEWVKSESLRAHCMGVALCMECYAIKYGLSDPEIDSYWITGLLHDFDYESAIQEVEKEGLSKEEGYEKILKLHPAKGAEVLKEKGYSEDIIDAIMGHGNHTGVVRESKMAKTLFAVDELSGFVIAVAKIRPEKFSGLSVKSVKKKLKKKDFAVGVSREDIKQGIEELEVEPTEHYQLIIDSLTKSKEKIGF